ncbi:MAG TPA: IucA/IucC family C-terminal-domain containing protein [Acidimicrobiales bacterium]|nr:IucA/IucC family C-terminal-domain containing protein [Acidimicrobiales bacterium]
MTTTVTYLRVTVGTEDTSADWLPCAELVSEPKALADLAGETAAGRGTDRQPVAMSLLVQGYAFRIASLAIGAWLLGDVVLDIAPERTAIAIGRHRPNAVRFDELRLVATDDPLATLQSRLLDGHLGPLVANAHASGGVGEAMLWADVGASCASSFRAFLDPLPDRRDEILDRARAFFASARPEVRASGTLVPVGTDWVWERRACCLWYQASGGSRCEDCSLWSAAERHARYAGLVEAQGGVAAGRGGRR